MRANRLKIKTMFKLDDLKNGDVQKFCPISDMEIGNHCDVKLRKRYFSNLTGATPKQVQTHFMNMSYIGHLQSLLEDIFQEFSPQFINKMH